MVKHIIRPQEVFLSDIADGSVDLYVRPSDHKGLVINEGDTIVFAGTYRRKVKAIRSYASFSPMLYKEDPNRIVPGGTRSTVMETLRKVYPRDKEDLGVLVFELEVGT